METDFSAGGGVKIGDSGDTCDGTIAGAIRYNDAGSDTLDYCNGVSWLTLLSSAVTGILDGGNATGAAITIGTNDNFALNFETNDTTRMTIDSSGFVGIGTNAPGAQLEVESTGAILRVHHAGNGLGAALTTNHPGLELMANNMNSGGQKYGPGIKFMSADGNFTTAGQKWLSGILPKGTEDYNADNTGGQALDFFVSPNTPGVSPVPTRAMSINHDGTVGIGIESPTAKLDVRGDLRTTGDFIVGSTDGNLTDQEQISYIEFRGNDSDVTTQFAHAQIEVVAGTAVATDAAVGDILFKTTGTTIAGSPVERMRVNYLGQVGIGTSVPAVELDVHTGTINAAQICDEDNANCLDLSAGVSGGDPSYGSSASSPNDAVYVNDSGFVGIGTTAPAADLDVAGVIRADMTTFSEPANAGTTDAAGDKLIVWESATHRMTAGMSANGMYLQNTGGSNTDGMRFITGSSTPVERMRITRDGAFGFGTTNPARPFHFSGADTSGNGIMALVENTASTGEPYSGFVFNTAGSTDGFLFAGKNTSLSFGIVPGITFRTGNNTQDIGFATGNASSGGASGPAMVIKPSGFVGIGTVTPDAALDVNTGSINAAQICDENNANCLDLSAGVSGGDPSYGSSASSPNDAVFVDDSGSVGVGTTAPRSKLHIGNNVSDVDSANQIRLYDGGGASGAVYGLGISALDFDLFSQSNYRFHVGSLENDRGSEVLTILSNGNIGIGSTSPGNILDIVSSGLDDGVRITNSNASSWASFYAINNLGNEVNFGIGGSSAPTVPNTAYFYAVNNTDFAIGTNNTTRMTVTSAGNVGIGTSVPAVELDVDVGTINAASICDENNANCLDLSAGVSGGDPSYGSSASSPNDAVYVDDSGWVGIGTTTNVANLSVYGSGGVDEYGISVTNSGAARYHLFNGGAVTEWVFGQKSSTDHSFKLSSLVSNVETDLLTVDLQGNLGLNSPTPYHDLDILDNNAGTEYDGASIQLVNTGSGDSVFNWLVTGRWWYAGIDNSDSDKFKIATTNTTPNLLTDSVFAIDVTGNIGVGTNTPSGEFHVFGDGTDAYFESNGLNGVGLHLVSSDTGGHDYELFSSASGNSIGAGKFTIHDITAATTRLLIDDNGLVGIGTTTPAVELDVNTGSINAAEICDENNANCLDLSTGLGGGGGDPSYGSSASSPNDAVYVNDSGNVGIGTTTAAEKLHLSGSNNIGLRLSGLVNNSMTYIEFTENNNIDGMRIEYDGSNGINEMNIKNYNSGAKIMTIERAGNVGIGTDAPDVELDVHTGSINAASICDENNANCLDLSAGVSGDNLGNHTATQALDMATFDINNAGTVNAVDFVLTSDRRFKENIETLEDALEKIMQVRGVSYFWNLDDYPNSGFTEDKQLGLIAQEIQKIFPEVVEEVNGHLAVKYTALVPVLIEATKAQQREISSLRQEVDDLKQQMKVQQEQIEFLMKKLKD